MSEILQVSEKQMEILRRLQKAGETRVVCSVRKTQSELARELGVTRQALSNHLRKLREMGLIRTGRGFIDITEKAFELLGRSGPPTFVLIKVRPQNLDNIYNKIKEINDGQVYRVTGEYDLIIQTSQKKLDELLKTVLKLEGVEKTSTYVSIEDF